MKMAAALSCVLTVLLLSVMNKAAEAAQLTINPPSLTLSGNSSVGTVRFICAVGSGVAQNDLLSLTISRVATSGLGQATQLGIASTRYNNGGVAKMDTPIAGATIEGSLSLQSITITMTETTCGADEATYICTSSSFPPTGTIPINAEDRKNFTVDVTAGTVSMTQDPLETRYLVKDTLTMRCNGQVGSNLPSVKIDWVWQYKDRTGFSYNDYVRSEDIMTEGIFQDTNNRCQYRQVSTLTRLISLEDYGREYRCFVRRNNVPSEPDSQHLDSYIIREVYEGQVTDTGNTGANTDTVATGVSLGPIIGGVLAAVAAVVAGVVVVVFLRIKNALATSHTMSKQLQNNTSLGSRDGSNDGSGQRTTTDSSPHAEGAAQPPVYEGLKTSEVGLASPYAPLQHYVNLRQPSDDKASEYEKLGKREVGLSSPYAELQVKDKVRASKDRVYQNSSGTK